MMENEEELQVLLALSEGDGWVKARINYKGEEGYVPQNYFDLHVDDSLPAMGLTLAAAATDDGESEYDDEYLTQASAAAAANDGSNKQNGHQQQQQQQEHHDGQQYRHHGSGNSGSRRDHPDVIREEIEPTEQQEKEAAAEDDMVAAYPLEAQISFSSVDYTYGNGTADGRAEDDEDYVDFPAPNDVDSIATASATAAVVLGYCRALYDYDATTDEELTFYEGEVIAVMRRSGVDGGNVDDGWWQGKLLPDGPVGVFPSLVVQECGPNGEDLSPSRVHVALLYFMLSLLRSYTFQHVYQTNFFFVNVSFSSMC